MLDVRNEPGRRFRPAGQFPSEGLKKPGRLRSVRIVEALSVKVLRKSWVACTLLHESPFIHIEMWISTSMNFVAPCIERVHDNILSLHFGWKRKNRLHLTWAIRSGPRPRYPRSRRIGQFDLRTRHSIGPQLLFLVISDKHAEQAIRVCVLVLFLQHELRIKRALPLCAELGARSYIFASKRPITIRT